MIKEIEKLNREIDRIMTEKTKADAQNEVWENRLEESISNYNKEYGVNLSGKDLSEIKKKLMAETKVVEDKTKEEFELSQKIVNLINEGDIKGAWRVLGVDIDAVNAQADVEPQEEVQEPKNTQAVQGATEVVEEMDDEAFFGESFEEDEEEPPVQNVKAEPTAFPINLNDKNTPFSPFMLEDDDEEEDEFVSPNTENSNSGGSNVNNSGSFVMEDDDEEDGFGGFGNILAGSKFKV
ncbi:hypothetical protein ACEE21_15085 [Clostridium baratii]